MEQRKKIIATVIGVAFLVVLVIGATAAYFGVGTSKDFTSDAITATSEELGTVALVAANNLRIELTKENMAIMDADKTYYASSNGTTEEETTEVIATTQTIEEGEYNCKYTLKVEDNEGGIYDAFQSMDKKSEGQIILIVDGKEYDFNKENMFPLLVSGKLQGVSKDTPQSISAGLKVINKSKVDQGAIAGNTLTLTFTVDSFSCTPSSIVENRLEGIANVSEELVGGMYRFQGDAATVNNNYLCFGTTSKDICLSDEGRGAYLYRIIGVNEDNEMKVIMNNPPQLAQWNADTTQDVEWPGSDVYNLANVQLLQMLDQQGLFYEGWEDFVVQDAKWKYGDVYDEMMAEYTASGNPDNINADFFYNLESNFTNEVTAAMGMMYVHDYLYSGNESRCLSEDYAVNCKNNWLHISYSDYYNTSGEWFLTRAGFVDVEGTSKLLGMAVEDSGYIQPYSTDESMAIRAVFYLKPSVTLLGSGTLEDPYIVS